MFSNKNKSRKDKTFWIASAARNTAADVLMILGVAILYGMDTSIIYIILIIETLFMSYNRL